MGDILSFKPAKHKNELNEEAPDGTELIYMAKEDSVAVKVFLDEHDVANFTITAPAADIEKVIASAEASLAATYGGDGNDKRIIKMLREQLNPETYNAFICNFAEQHFFAKALLRTGIMPFLHPAFSAEKNPEPGEDFVFKAQVPVRPSYELTSYEPVRIQVPPQPEVSGKDVTAFLDNMANELGEWQEDKSRTEVQAGDHVTLNLESNVEGKPVRELTGRHLPFVIGGSMLGEEFDSQIIGMKPRERKQFTLTLPAMGSDGAPQDMQIEVKAQLDEIQHKVPARIDDAWVMKNMPEAQTLLGLRSKVRTMLEQQSKDEYHAQLLQLCAEELSTRLADEIDERYVNLMSGDLENSFKQELALQGLDYEKVLEAQGMDKEAWQEDMYKQAYDALSRGFALDALADHLDIQLTEEDILDAVQSNAPGREAQVLQALIDSGQMPYMCEVAMRKRANEWLVEHLPSSTLNSAKVIQGGKSSNDAPKDPGSGPKLILV
ncbi:MAG: hypothetical protein IKE43_02850 [Coriobacteriales bacterium]|nr:hypothetical protein [Coriobacteriales bacterium]